MIKYSILLLTLIVASFVSCGKNGSSFRSEISNQESKKSKKRDCQNLNYHKNIFQKQSVINLFNCLGWDKEFSELYRAVDAIDGQDWDKVMFPFNMAYSNDKEKTGKLISNINYLGQFDFFYILLENLKRFDWGSELLKSEKNEEYKNDLLDWLSPQSKALLSSVVDYLSLQFKGRPQVLRDLISNFFNEEDDRGKDFISVLIAGLSVEDIKLILAITSNSDFGEAISSLSKNDLDKIIFVNTEKSGELYQNILALQKAMPDEIVCYGENINTKVNIPYIISKRVRDFSNLDYTEYDDYLLESLQKVLIFDHICAQSNASNDFYQNVFQVGSSLSKMFSTKPTARFFDLVFEAYVKKNRELDFWHLFSSENFSTYVRFLEMLSQKSVLAESKISVTMYEILGKFQDPQLVKQFNRMLGHLIQNEMYSSLQKVWLNLDSANKAQLFDLIEIFANNTMPEGLTSPLQNFFLKQDLVTLDGVNRWYISLLNIYHLLEKHHAKNDIQNLLSKHNLFKLVSLLELKQNERNEAIETIASIEEKNYTSSQSMIQDQAECLDFFFQNYKEGFLNFIVDYPQSCREQQNRFYPQMFVWSYDLEQYFKNYGEISVHREDGIFSAEMSEMYLIFMLATHDYLSKDGQYKMSEVVSSIQDTLLSPAFSELIIDLLDFSLGLSNQDKTIEENLLAWAQNDSLDDFQINFLPYIRNTVKAYPNTLIMSTSYKSCEDTLSLDFTSKTCLGKEDLKEIVQESYYLLSKRNPDVPQITNLLLDAINPNKGIMLPAGPHVVTLDEVFRFAFDMSSDLVVEDIYYNTPGKSKSYKMDLLTQLEILLRDISFFDNYYGAFFKNKVADAFDYSTTIKKQKKSLKMMSASSSLLRSSGRLPYESKWQLANVYNTYDSLWKLDMPVKQTDGTYKQYGNFIQSIIVAAVKSSPLETQDIGTLKKPDEDFIKDHQGKLITTFAKYSLLRNMARFVRSEYVNKENFENDSEFQEISSNLFKKFDFNVLTKVIQENLDKPDFLKNIYQMIDFLFDTPEKEFFLIKKIIKNILLIVSRSNVKFSSIFESSISGFDISIFDNFIPEERMRIVKIIYEFTNQLLLFQKQNPEYINNLLDQINDLGENTQSNTLDKDKILQISKLVKKLSLIIEDQPERLVNILDWIDFLQGNKNFSSGPLKRMILTIYSKDDNLNYLNQVLGSLTDKVNYVSLITKIFSTNSRELVDMLEEIFGTFEVVNKD